MTFLKQYLKWVSTALVLAGILLTNLNIYPLNIFFSWVGGRRLDCFWNLK